MTDARITFDSIWGEKPRTMTADTDLERILVNGARLPLPHWRKNFFFMGCLNQTFKTLTRGEFPAKADPRGTHPVFALRPILDHAGFKSCPCSSSTWNRKKWVEKGTLLMHTGWMMNKTTCLIEDIRFNIPASKAVKVRFKGEVTAADIRTLDERNAHDRP